MIVILLSTYNGEKYLREQLDSIIAQKGVDIRILVRDDGSSDSTLSILDEYQKRGLLTWYSGSNLGPARSFMDLIYNAPEADYYAFADQDDYWMDDKLSSAITKLEEADNNIPALYFSALEVVDENLNSIFIDNKKSFKRTFGEAVFRNAATGCTMVFNNTLKRKIAEHKPEFILMHDYWVYFVCLAIDGKIFFDPQPHIKYRQHGKNVVGSRKKGIISFVEKRIKLVKGESKKRIRHINTLLNCYEENISDPVKKEMLNDIVDYRKTFRNKIKILRNPNFRFKTLSGNIDVFFAVLFNKL